MVLFSSLQKKRGQVSIPEKSKKMRVYVQLKWLDLSLQQFRETKVSPKALSTCVGPVSVSQHRSYIIINYTPSTRKRFLHCLRILYTANVFNAAHCAVPITTTYSVLHTRLYLQYHTDKLRLQANIQKRVNTIPPCLNLWKSEEKHIILCTKRSKEWLSVRPRSFIMNSSLCVSVWRGLPYPGWHQRIRISARLWHADARTPASPWKCVFFLTTQTLRKM